MMGTPSGYIYDFTFITPRTGGGYKNSRFAVDASDVMGDMCRVLFVDDIEWMNDPVMFSLPRARLMEMVKLMVHKEGML